MKTEKENKLPLDKRIIKVLEESWIAPTYFYAGVVELLNKVNAMSDEELTKYMDGLISPNTARAHIKEIYERIK